MVGDRVSVEHDNTRRYGVISQIQDTARLHNIFTGQLADESLRSLTYHITLEGSNQQITKYKAAELQRDRRVYSKLVLKQFLRSAVSREPWNGAPWRVKDHLAKRYNISTKVPEAKTRDAVMAAKKAANAANLNQNLPGGLPNLPYGQQPNDGHMPPMQGPHSGSGQTSFVNFPANPQQALYGDPTRHLMQQGLGEPPGPHSFHGVPHINGRGHAYQPLLQLPHLPQNLPPHLAHIAQHIPPPGSGLPISLPFQNNFMQYQTLAPTTLPQQSVPISKPFEKYPMEDLRIRQPKTSERPILKFFSDDVPEGAEPSGKETGILMESVGSLLTSWNTLNVHDTIFSLDSFTLDDFVSALRFSSEEIECELLNEIHCSILKQIVDDDGKVQPSTLR